MADHNDLIAEMSILEQMGTQERQKLAKKRRLQQLKKWGQREKEYISKEKQLNKRLASKLNEENNGLNLKQYSIYDSNGRTNKLTLSSSNNIPNNTTTLNGTKNNNSEFIKNPNSNNNLNGCLSKNNNRYKNTNGINSSNKLTNESLRSQLVPNGRVHFNVGVMLLEAAARNDFDEVKRLLLLGVSPDSINHDGLTALHQCCIDASEPMMNLLLEFGANVDARDTEQWTPLHAACTCGHLNLVKVLVEHGADLLAVNGDGNMPFDICEDESTLSYIESQMVDRGITQEMIDITRASTEMQMISDLEKLVSEYETKDMDGISNNNNNNNNNNNRIVNILNEPVDKKNNVTFLHIAAANGYLSAVKFLLKHGVNVDACDNDLWRPLHGAACWGNEQHAQVIELLIESGAQLDAKTINEETVFDLCDNAELLDKLHQIKDDLESKKAATGSDDRLKRTQSRTNSRIHSVRRTSVRDKNQISRREAREEALLRVENSPLVNTTNTADGINLGIETAKSKSEQNDSKLTDEIDCNINKEIKQTDLDEENSENYMLKSEQINVASNTSAHTSSNESIIQKNNLSNKRKQLVKQASLIQDSISIDPTATTHNSTIKSLSTSMITNSSSNKIALSTDKKIKKTTTVSLGFTTNSNSTTSNTACDLTDSNHNSNGNNNNDSSKLSSTKTSTVVLIAPNNYTLSNLKKQRSDLRMRTSCIGGGTVTNTTTTNTTSNGMTLTTLQSTSSTITSRQQAISNNNIDTTPVTENSNSNGLKPNQQQYRPESPSFTFRKFSGELSETVDGKRKNKHKCCILM